jgi:hypothetical protein
MKAQKLKSSIYKYVSVLPLLIISLLFVVSIFSHNSSPQISECSGSSCSTSNIRLDNGCGAGSGLVTTSINFGCKGNNCSYSEENATGSPASYCSTYHNGITDLIFAIIRFLSDGVGLVVIASVMVGGIQYIGARGDPNATSLAVNRLTSSIVALIIFIFAYAILDYVIPAGFFSN